MNIAKLLSEQGITTNITRYGQIRTVWMDITPGLAMEFLAQNRRNRRFMPSLASRYELDMSSGLWLVTHEGIAFDESDNLIDGQHRLEAISASGKTTKMLVTFGLPAASIEVINRGKIRTLAHVLQIMGYEHSDHRIIAAARRMHFGPIICGGSTSRNPDMTDSIMRKFIDLNLESLIFATSVVKKTTGPAALVAVIARAFYHADTERLARFPVAMSDGIEKDDMLPGDRSARTLKSLIEKKMHGGDSHGQAVFYRKAQNALRAYLDKIDLSKLYEAEDDLFPIPLEKRASSLKLASDAA